VTTKSKLWRTAGILPAFRDDEVEALEDRRHLAGIFCDGEQLAGWKPAVLSGLGLAPR